MAGTTTIIRIKTGNHRPNRGNKVKDPQIKTIIEEETSVDEVDTEETTTEEMEDTEITPETETTDIHLGTDTDIRLEKDSEANQGKDIGIISEATAETEEDSEDNQEALEDMDTATATMMDITATDGQTTETGDQAEKERQKKEV